MEFRHIHVLFYVFYIEFVMIFIHSFVLLKRNVLQIEWWIPILSNCPLTLFQGQMKTEKFRALGEIVIDQSRIIFPLGKAAET